MRCYTVQKDIIILKCQCMLCKNCLKSELLNENKNLLLNPFETFKEKESMCSCSMHNCCIEPKLLHELFTPEELENYSLSAMKRQLKESKETKNKLPNICIQCKKVICDNDKTCDNLCYRHKLCRTCIEYIYNI